jgi:hypothetical protein
MRIICNQSTLRNCQIFSEYSSYVSRVKFQAEGVVLWDPDNELAGPTSGPGSAFYRYANTHIVLQSNQFGGSGDVPPSGTTISFAPQNNDVGPPPELHEFITVEDCVDSRSAASIVRGGANLGARGLRNPDTTPWQNNETDNGINRIPTDKRGPYTSEADNTRPIPSAF